MVTYQFDNWLECLDELKAIIGAHYDELCVTKTFPLDPVWESYEALWLNGNLRFITARDDGEMVGYIIFFVMPGLHYRTCFTAQEDIYFLRKEYRKGRTGIKMFQYAEKALKDEGVQRLICNTKVHSDNSRLFEYLGYKFIDKVFSKLI